MKSSVLNDRDFFECVRRNESLRRLRDSFDTLAGNPVWWVSFKVTDNVHAFRVSLESSYEIWSDPRLKKFRHAPQLYAVLRRHGKDPKPHLFRTPGGTLHYCVPIRSGERTVGFLGLSDVRKGVSESLLRLLAENLGLVVEVCAKGEELKRLSATIRPRAIALSTVHTVHRIINSTLNLDELISRLAHLTAQVLRANRCSIHLVERPHGRRARVTLVCKALVGFPKHRQSNRRIPMGAGVEGLVAKTARTVLRRKFICLPLIDEDVMGVMTVLYKKDGREFTHFDQEILTTLAEEAVIAIKNAQLYEEQKRVTLGTIQSLAVILGTRVNNVVAPEVFLRVALKMAQELHLSDEDTQALHYATLLKDTARVGIPDEILKKPTRLTGEEYQLLRDHPIKGAKIVQSFESLKPVVPIILYSREKFDGTGYPEGLKGEGIPVGARILSVINAFEAIITGRPYRDRSSLEDAMTEIHKNSGTQFDPRVVEAFDRVIKREGVERLLRHGP
ncbi:MAG TPA: HD domain-containing phosphohydrolase [Candidatus Eisenbacteria bacterium]|nr:HD domain-containing phosphohydrolase [Candidatus Eisenbacteria bacterium]